MRLDKYLKFPALSKTSCSKEVADKGRIKSQWGPSQKFNRLEGK